MGEHAAALRDISRALGRNYPANLHHKLLERKAKCLAGLKLFQEAAAAFEEAVKVSPGNTKGGSINVPLTSSLTGSKSAV